VDKQTNRRDVLHPSYAKTVFPTQALFMTKEPKAFLSVYKGNILIMKVKEKNNAEGKILKRLEPPNPQVDYYVSEYD